MDELDQILAESANEPYLDKHRPSAQRLVDGVPVDPTQRHCFDCTANEDRDSQELADWWNLPYVVSHRYHAADASYADFCKRLEGYGTAVKETEAEYNARLEQHRRDWFEEWPSGVRYDVRCLDGGAWDRSTWRGSFGTEGEAVAHGKALIEQGGPVIGKRFGLRAD